MIAWKCQIICPNCGARLDCSDLFVEYDASWVNNVVNKEEHRDEDFR